MFYDPEERKRFLLLKSLQTETSHWHWMLHHWNYLMKSWLTHKIEEISYIYKEVRPIYQYQKRKIGIFKSHISIKQIKFMNMCIFLKRCLLFSHLTRLMVTSRKVLPAKKNIGRFTEAFTTWEDILTTNISSFSFWYFFQLMLPVILTFFRVTIEYRIVTRTFKSLKNPPWEAEQRWWCTWTKLGSCPSLQW